MNPTARYDRGPMTKPEKDRLFDGNPEFEAMNENPPDSVVKVKEQMQGKTAAGDYQIQYQVPGKGWKTKNFKDQAAAKKWVEKFKADDGDDVVVNWPAPSKKANLMTAEEVADALKEGKFEKGKPADPTENMTPEDAKEWEEQNEAHKDEFKAAMAENPDVPFDLFFNGRTAAEVKATGKWGFPKSIEAACTAGVSKLQKAAGRIAKVLYAKDDKTPAFLQKHAARGGSKTASMLLKAMEGLSPLAGLAKTAGRTGNGLYGFPSKTAKLGLEACGALHHEAGEIACDLFARKGADPGKIAGFLKKNASKGKCAYSAMLDDCCPDFEPEVVASVTKKASDFMASDESEVADLLDGIMADESTHPSFVNDQDIPGSKC